MRCGGAEGEGYRQAEQPPAQPLPCSGCGRRREAVLSPWLMIGVFAHSIQKLGVQVMPSIAVKGISR